MKKIWPVLMSKLVRAEKGRLPIQMERERLNGIELVRKWKAHLEGEKLHKQQQYRRLLIDIEGEGQRLAQGKITGPEHQTLSGAKYGEARLLDGEIQAIDRSIRMFEGIEAGLNKPEDAAKLKSQIDFLENVAQELRKLYKNNQ
ncbi:MAG: hypothetical protein HY544_01500 [Candidatus Diapherotrites archaeon]|uniref:Uncharacterized protein n=1 Tax=Candidatus Iainarchaeum sp. TaxID=3101447 RepID=A0A8T3YLI2_9ARCH|nr:hypothetical protein [Candidatus Diapherotrites archaeon]